MKDMLEHVKALRDLFLRIAEMGLALVALILVVYLLLGAGGGSYVVAVVANLSLLIDALSPQALVTFALVLAILAWMKQNKG